MIVARLVLLFILAADVATGAPFQTTRTAACADWRECRQLALSAADRGDYETFHDLAWRAVQSGPPKNPDLMLLLARAQSLSGRPHDALVMLQRLAEIGAPSDAATSDDFIRTRQLHGWPEVQARLELSNPPAAGAAAVQPRPSSPVSPAASTPAATAGTISAPSPSAIGPTSAAEALRFSTNRLALGGLAYDSVSHRFLVGDRLGRKVMVVSEGSDSVVDLVRSDSAGFHDIAAVEIDAKRGDLWVASNELADGTGALHRLQLVSGRPLKTFDVSPDLGPVTLVDLGISPAGAILMLDSTSRQILSLRAGGASLERLVQIDAPTPVSLAISDDDGIVFVAHGDGISRVDLRAKTATLLAVPKDVSLVGLERIRWHRRTLIAVQIDADNSRRIVRLELNGQGRTITRATTLEASRPVAGKTFLVVSGDELIYLAGNPARGVGRQSSNGSPEASDFVAYRLRLR